MRFRLKSIAAVMFVLCGAFVAVAQDAPLRRPAPVTMSELAKLKTAGVSVVEVSDYVYGNYRGGFESPPHADLNPKRAFVIHWRDLPQRFVFSHEASYCPWFELPSGVALSYQMWEGNEGWGELFIEQGRRERNSFVEVVEPGPRRVWVRWTYFGVNMKTGAAAYRATEDFWAFPNGLVLRRQSYESLMPGDNHGYAREPIELIAMTPVGQLWFDVLEQDAVTGESRAFVGLDAFTPARADVYWKPAPRPGKPFTSTARRTGSAWKELDDARGFVGLIPFRDGSPFFAIGEASGFPVATTRMKEHSDKATGGWGWRSLSWDHWPVGWLNSQAHDVDDESYKKYPSHFAPFGLDLWSMKNEETERRDFYSLMGVAGKDVESVRHLAREWLTKGATDPARVAALRLARDAAHSKQ